MKNIILLTLSLVSLTLNAQFNLTSSNKNIVKVKGEFITKQKPENIVVNLRVTESDNNYQNCFSTAFQTRKKMIQAFESSGIKKEYIKTKELFVEEQYGWEEKEERHRYKASINMQIEKKYTNEFADRLLQSLKNYTFQVNYSIRFILSENQKKMLRHEAIKQAVADATTKAQLIANASSIQLGGINKITYGEMWDTGFNNIDNDLVSEIEYDSPFAIIKDHGMNYEKGIDFNPKEISIKKTVMVEWNIDR